MRSPYTMPAATLLAALLWLSGCAAGKSDSSATPATSDSAIGTGSIEAAGTAGSGDTNTATEGSTTSTGDIDQGLQPYIDLAVGDLTQRLTTKVEHIIVTSATVVVWPDSSLGCPAPGQEYAQVTTDGALILLQVDGTEYPYHAGGSRLPFLCEKPGKSLTATETTDL
ncbi:MAG TPA: hypothetical protein PK020_02465 [Ilumatobacteraceae bacterium]|nr:hypothetical protein [Ilumatobacteraceae bacterium]HRB02717.1 hypothetical protein [Ilumatobacteraceae bacterium]